MIKKTFLIKIIGIGIIVFIVSHYFFQIAFVNGNSMFPTLKNNNILLIRKFSLDVKRNDIILAKKNNNFIIKRVIGIPYDVISINNGYVNVNYEQFDNLYIENCGILINQIQLGENQYFVLGDNRNDSIDSRFDEIGIVNKDEIIGISLFKK